jgi:Ni/Fe-hydrogenase subunit HybB-like protein
VISRTRVIKDVLWAVALAGLVGACLRLWFGLGATTNLSDAVPWGLWKILNMVGGVALSTSGFTVGFLVYVLGLKRFQPFMKPAILIAFLGYGCSCTALLLDIGLPQRFWHPIFMWNENSFLFEVFWCVMLYFTVTAIELSPLMFERFRAEKVAHFLHRVAFGIVVIGISLSCLHHSSLGSLFLVTPQRLYPLWYTPWLPWLFITSAMGAGLMVVVLVKMLWARWYDPVSVFGPEAGRPTPLIRVINGRPVADYSRGPEGPEMAPIRSLATIAAGVLAAYFVLKVADLFLHGGLTPLLAGDWESWLYLVELALTAVVPVFLVALPWSRHSPAGIAVAAASAAMGLALNRLDVGIFGYFHNAHTVYFPSLIEWAVSLGVVAAAGLVFLFLAENLPIFSERPPGAFNLGSLPRLSYGTLRQLWNTTVTDSLQRVTLIGLFVVPLAFVLMYPPYYHQQTPEPLVRPAIGVDTERTKLEMDGDQGGVVTIFPHAELEKRLGGSKSCTKCHHLSLPHDKWTPCWRCHRHMNAPTDIFDHAYHIAAVARADGLTGVYPGNYSCTKCHPAGQAATASNAKDCLDCHKQDMYPGGPPVKHVDLRFAISFREAMHRSCVECHNTEAVKQNKPHLADCGTCHRSLRARPEEQPVVAHLSPQDHTAP